MRLRQKTDWAGLLASASKKGVCVVGLTYLVKKISLNGTALNMKLLTPQRVSEVLGPTQTDLTFLGMGFGGWF